jgi:hypothetical protein
MSRAERPAVRRATVSKHLFTLEKIVHGILIVFLEINPFAKLIEIRVQVG